ncbi:MAG: multiprotein-bridging factor 1 family protein [Candidatus ainarchaeum sp.]|nr:multiprotein-bridging factor 1 family protein [Candidatus ainarchaeum sp.]MDD5096319.1 multiprotein-bridging factor 1 family protein [Candidatus ainarchaeum sp.]
MVDCDICGRKGVAFIIAVEGAKMAVCPRCAYHGKILHSLEGGEAEQEAPAKIDYSTPRQFRVEDEIVDGYGRKIRRAREAVKIAYEEVNEYGKKEKKARVMTIDELARKVNEKASWLDRVENERMEPTLEEAKKLEKALGIKLVEKVEVSVTPTPKSGGGKTELTLFDMMEMQKKKKEK